MKEVSEASVHWRRRGSCHSRRFSAKLRTIQIGSWWLTATASCGWCSNPLAPASGYYARVLVSSDRKTAFLAEELWNTDIAGASPVVVQSGTGRAR